VAIASHDGTEIPGPFPRLVQLEATSRFRTCSTQVNDREITCLDVKRHPTSRLRGGTLLCGTAIRRIVEGGCTATSEFTHEDT
jgi:hypothetical protein